MTKVKSDGNEVVCDKEKFTCLLTIEENTAAECWTLNFNLFQRRFRDDFNRVALPHALIGRRKWVHDDWPIREREREREREK